MLGVLIWPVKRMKGIWSILVNQSCFLEFGDCIAGGVYAVNLAGIKIKSVAGFADQPFDKLFFTGKDPEIRMIGIRHI